LIAYFTPNRLAHVLPTGSRGSEADPRHGAGRFGDNALLIMGLPRSGTTLVEQILSSHPQVHGGGELHFWSQHGASWQQAIECREATIVAEACGEDAAFSNARKLGAEYMALLHELAPRSVRVTDKAPLNILWAGLIHLALP